MGPIAASILRSQLQTAVWALAAGGVFTAVGLVLVTNYRGLAHWLMRSNDESDDIVSRSVRRFNVRVLFGGDEARFTEYKLNVVPNIVGAGFMFFGAIALVSGVVHLVRAWGS